MPINPTPTMTLLLVEAGAFSREPFILVDIGARGGLKGHWRAFGKDLRLVGFEPHPEEFRRLQLAADPRTTILPFGLGGRDEVRTLYIHRNPSSSSLFIEDPAFVQRMTLRDAFTTVGEQPIELRRLDDVAAAIGDVDFFDLDTEGAELEIMRAGTTLLSRTETLGLFTEIRFHEGFGTPLFWQVDEFVRSLGFSLYDLGYSRESHSALPYPMFVDARHDTDPTLRISSGRRPAVNWLMVTRSICVTMWARSSPQPQRKY